MATKQEILEDENSCFNRAQDDEPLFVLRANDELAPDIIREWARRYYNSKMDRQGHPTAAQHEKKETALKDAAAMERWLAKQARNIRARQKAEREAKAAARKGAV